MTAADELLNILPAERGLTPEAQARRAYLAHVLTTSLEPARARRFGLHLLAQYERASAGCADRLAALSQAKRALDNDDLAAIDALLPLAKYPWQRDSFAYWSDRSSATRGARLLELLPERPDEPRPYTADERPVVFFFSGNRQAYVGAEHEPASAVFGQDLQALASSYVARCGGAVMRMLRETPLRNAKLVMPVYGALQSRHEQRLIHFALSQDPEFVHPSITETADAVLDALQLQTCERRAASDLRRFRVVTHSYGSSVVVQCLTHIRRRLQNSGDPSEVLPHYLASGVCIQFGGYRLQDLPSELAPHYHCVLSPLDEVALGSAGSKPRYTSPVSCPGGIWSGFSRESLAALVGGQFEHVPVLRATIKPGVDLWCPALEGFNAYDASGNPIAVLEQANGHFLSGYTEAAVQRFPALLDGFCAPN